MVYGIFGPPSAGGCPVLGPTKDHPGLNCFKIGVSGMKKMKREQDYNCGLKTNAEMFELFEAESEEKGMAVETAGMEEFRKSSHIS
jgi:hypothetical protein